MKVINTCRTEAMPSDNCALIAIAAPVEVGGFRHRQAELVCPLIVV